MPENKHHTGVLLYMFLKKDLRERYLGSVMGFYWSVINPLILMLLYLFVFSVILNVKFAGLNPALYIFCGMVPWLTFQESVQRSIETLITHKGLIKNVKFPSELLVANMNLSSMFNGLLGMVLLIIATVFLGNPGPALIFLPVVVIVQLIFSTALSWLLSTLNVYFRDVGHLTGVMMVVWLFLTPIFYPESYVPDSFSIIVKINPMAHLVSAYRQVILYGQMPHIRGFISLSVLSVILFFTGYFYFRKNSMLFGDIL